MDTSYTYILNQYQDNLWEFIFRVLPLLALIIGLFLNHFYKLYNERKQRIETKKYLLYSVKTLIAASKIQHESFKLLISQLEKNPTDIPLLFLSTGFHLGNVDIIDKAELFKILVLKRRGNKEENSKLMNQYNDALELIRGVLEQSKDEINGLRRIDNEGKFKYNTLFDELKNIINTKTIRSSRILSGDMLIKDPQIYIDIENDKKILIQIQNLYKEFSENFKLEKNLFNHYEFFIKPLFEIAKENNDYEFTSILPSIIEHCEGYIKTRLAFLSIFRQLHGNLNVAIMFLEEVTKSLS